MPELLADSAVQLQTTMPVLHSLALQQHLRLTGLLTEKTNQSTAKQGNAMCNAAKQRNSERNGMLCYLSRMEAALGRRSGSSDG